MTMLKDLRVIKIHKRDFKDLELMELCQEANDFNKLSCFKEFSRLYKTDPSIEAVIFLMEQNSIKQFHIIR